MDDDRLKATWDALCYVDPTQFGKEGWKSEWQQGFTMDDWAQGVDGEMEKRGLKGLDKEEKQNYGFDA